MAPVEALRAETGFTQRPVLRLLKRIPAQAGLGGGSSDAAATLRLVNHVYRLGVANERLHEIAAELGSDVPFFVETSAALVQGRGERLTRMAIQEPTHVVVLKPTFGLSTAEMFRRSTIPTTRRKPNRLLAALIVGLVDEIAPELRNDLQSPAIAVAPEIATHVEALRQAGAVGAMMSGSGSAVFGLFPTRQSAIEASKRLKTAFPGEVFVAETFFERP
ncbi:MAG: 4-(cytidine 5'-diphospho)-2-C-methyl-D-erythritol kinase [Pirellulales bacterium]